MLPSLALSYMLFPSSYNIIHVEPTTRLLDRDGFGQIAGEINVQSFSNRQPICDQLEGNDVEKALQSVHRLWYLDALRLVWRELGVILVANDNRSTTASND